MGLRSCGQTGLVKSDVGLGSVMLVGDSEGIRGTDLVTLGGIGRFGWFG